MVTLYLLLGLVYNAQNPSWNTTQYAALWSKVEKALDAGKPQTAAGYLSELETMTREKGDDLERLEVMKQRYECLTRYNWKDARDYYTRYSALQDSIFRDLDANIEKYCRHPRVIMLITEKIERTKREQDYKSDANKDETVYKKVREMCQAAIKAFPKSSYAKELKSLIDEMDSRRLNSRGKDKGYPGTAITYIVNSKNVASADFAFPLAFNFS